MVQTLIFSLIYGPVAVTLGCWLFCAIGAARARQVAVILISSRDRRRLRSERPYRPVAPGAAEPARLAARDIVGHTPFSPLRRLMDVANGAN